MFREPASELLAVVLDARLVEIEKPATQPKAEPGGHKEKAGRSTATTSLFPCIWDAMLVLFRSHATLGLDRRVLLMGVHARRAVVLASGLYSSVDWQAARGLGAKFFMEDGAFGGGRQPLVSVALSKVLCHVNRVRLDAALPEMPARVLLMDGSSRATDFAVQGTALTSGAFAAKNIGVVVDCFSLGPEASALLRQVTILTEGKHQALGAYLPKHLALGASEVLVPMLLFHFLPGLAVRKELNTMEDFQNLAAICNCHGESLEIAHVCSCCLAIYCSGARAICAVCRTRFRQEHDTDPRICERDLFGDGLREQPGSDARTQQ